MTLLLFLILIANKSQPHLLFILKTLDHTQRGKRKPGIYWAIHLASRRGRRGAVPSPDRHCSAALGRCCYPEPRPDDAACNSRPTRPCTMLLPKHFSSKHYLCLFCPSLSHCLVGGPAAHQHSVSRPHRTFYNHMYRHVARLASPDTSHLLNSL